MKDESSSKRGTESNLLASGNFRLKSDLEILSDGEEIGELNSIPKEFWATLKQELESTIFEITDGEELSRQFPINFSEHNEDSHSQDTVHISENDDFFPKG